MREQYTYVHTDSSITIFENGAVYTAGDNHPNYTAIIARVKKGYKNKKGIDKTIALFDTVKAVQSYVRNGITISDNGVVSYRGEVIANVLTAKIVNMMKEGWDINPMVNFLIKLRDNPSKTAQNELMLFMEANNMPITKDGHILAYKAVRHDYKDIHSGTFDNSVGAVNSMPRRDVDDDRATTCSTGLHFAAKEYAHGFGSSTGHLMVLSINPADVVSIPLDYNNQKGRCCRYTVVDEVANAMTDNTIDGSAVYDEDDDEDYDENEC